MGTGFPFTLWVRLSLIHSCNAFFPQVDTRCEIAVKKIGDAGLTLANLADSLPWESTVAEILTVLAALRPPAR